MLTTMVTIMMYPLMMLTSYGQWISYSDPVILKKDMQMAVGVWDANVYLLGGYNTLTRRTIMLFDGNLFENGADVLSLDTWGYGDYYAQIGSKIYMIDPSGISLNVFDMAVTYNPLTFTTMEWDVNEQSCLAATDEQLFVIGGSSGSTLDTVRILNIAQMIWDTGLSMNTARRQHSCIIDPSTKNLYAIGGTNGTSLNSVEFINSTNMVKWENIQPGLTDPATNVRSITHGQYIYVVGGYYWDGTGHWLDTVHIINPIQNTITLSSDRLSYGVWCIALCVFNDLLHVFGGNDNYGYTDKWMTYEIPTFQPTIHPTRNSTKNPTKDPTADPTENPTTGPTTASPTNYPTVNPTKSPTFNPSEAPTYTPTIPTQTPTKYPTFDPTPAPTDGPSSAPIPPPTDDPVSDPTPSPTDNPTPSPTSDPTPSPTADPTPSPTDDPTPSPTDDPTSSPTYDPTSSPTYDPTSSPTYDPTDDPASDPTPSPTDDPTPSPTTDPTPDPIDGPPSPTADPTPSPTTDPTPAPIDGPVSGPIPSPTDYPTSCPTYDPASDPTPTPTADPTPSPTDYQTSSPTYDPTPTPTNDPTKRSNDNPISSALTDNPTETPTDIPTTAPTDNSAKATTDNPTDNPTKVPTNIPTNISTATLPTESPTIDTDGACDDDDNLERDDCDESGDEPSKGCSLLVQSTFDVCYIDCYKDQRSRLWNDIKSCLCKNIFASTPFDDNEKKCYIEKYHYGNLVDVYNVYPTVTDNEQNCTLQQLFNFSTAIYGTDCEYAQTIYDWGLDQGNALLNALADCNLLYSTNVSSNYPNGFVGISSGVIQIQLRDENGDVVHSVVAEDKGVFHSIITPIAMVLLLIFYL